METEQIRDKGKHALCGKKHAAAGAMKPHQKGIPALEARTNGSYPLLIAHRGAMAEAPENSAAAFDVALTRQVDGIEFDVRLSADGVPVVFHDDALFRITGKNGSVFDYPFDTLRTFDYGKWFSETFAGTSLMRLKDVLGMYAHKTSLMIELKTGPTAIDGFAEKRSRLSETVAEMIMTNVPENCIGNMHVLSFDHEALMIAHSHAPSLKYIFNIDHDIYRQFDITARNPAIYGYGVPLADLDDSLVRYGHRYGKRIMTYSCNTVKQMHRVLDANADFILTDDPAAVVPYFRASRQRLKQR
jgi:glycerophosphoryl diester phosphodiesterase